MSLMVRRKAKAPETVTSVTYSWTRLKKKKIKEQSRRKGDQRPSRGQNVVLRGRSRDFGFHSVNDEIGEFEAGKRHDLIYIFKKRFFLKMSYHQSLAVKIMDLSRVSTGVMRSQGS